MVQKLLVVMCVSLLFGSNAIAQSNDTDKLIGAVVGGAIGSTIGDGDGQKIATALGALIGARMADGQRYERRDFIRECRRNVPAKYRSNDGARKAWIEGCVHNLEEVQARLEREAYNEGLNP
jgi:outer membrane lipoprotein SlyB